MPKGDELQDFLLAGAIYVKNRTSEDLDFFIHKNIIINKKLHYMNLK